MLTDINAKKILEEVAGPTDREKVSLFISGVLYKKFRKACEDSGAPPPRVLERLLELFLESLDNEK